MISNDEQNSLDETARCVALDDPALAAQLRCGTDPTGPPPGVRDWAYLVGSIAAVVLAVGLLWLALPAQSLLMAATAGALTAWWRRGQCTLTSGAP